MKEVYNIQINNGVGGYFEDYIIVCDNINSVYEHFFKIKDKCFDNLTLNINNEWNLGFREPKYIITKEELKFNIEGVNKQENDNITENTFNLLLCYYCKKFKVKVKDLNIADIKNIFDDYCSKYMDGINITKIEKAFIY